MSKRGVQKKLVYEGAVGRYRTLMMNSRDPARRRMLEEMIARELRAAKQRDAILVPMEKRDEAGRA